MLTAHTAPFKRHQATSVTTHQDKTKVRPKRSDPSPYLSQYYDSDPSSILLPSFKYLTTQQTLQYIHRPFPLFPGPTPLKGPATQFSFSAINLSMLYGDLSFQQKALTTFAPYTRSINLNTFSMDVEKSVRTASVPPLLGVWRSC